MSESRTARLQRLAERLEGAALSAVLAGQRRRLRAAEARYNRVLEALVWTHWTESLTFGGKR